MSLHYRVKLEMLIEDVIPLSCYRKKLQNLSHLNCGLQIRQIWIQLITVCGIVAREGAKTGITDLELPRTQLTNGCHNNHIIQLGHSVLSRWFSLFRSVMGILCTLSCNSPHTLYLTGIKSDVYRGHSRSGEKFSSFFSVTTQWQHALDEHFKFHKVV